MWYKLLDGLFSAMVFLAGVLFSVMVFLAVSLAFLSMPTALQEAIPIPGTLAGLITVLVMVRVVYGP